MGEDTDVYISKESLRKMVQEFDLDSLWWLLLKVRGIRWYRFLEHLDLEEEEIPEHTLRSEEIIHHLALTRKKLAWREMMVKICENYDLVFQGDWALKKFKNKGFISLDELLGKFEQTLKKEVGLNGARC